MDVTYLDHVPLSGPFVELELQWAGAPSGPRVPLTFNQRNHLAAVAASGQSTWIGGTVDISSPDGTPAWSDAELADAVHAVVVGAPSLRRVASDDVDATFSPDALTVSAGQVRPVPTEVELADRIAAACLPGAVPGVYAARAGTTLLFAIDHVHGDMLSIDLALRRLWDALHGRPVTEADTEPTPASDSSATTGAALDVWKRFFTVTEGHVPAFPVQLSTGMTGPVHDVRSLTPAAALDGDLDHRTFAVILTTLAEAMEPVTGSPEFATVIPVHTRGRRDDPRHDVVGWMVSNAPVVARAGDTASTARWLRDAVTVSTLPLETMIQECRPALPAGVVPMVSYMDFRHRGDPLPQARYISSTSPTDTAQLWFSRTRDGLAVRAKYPDTPEARQVMGGVLDRLSAALW